MTCLFRCADGESIFLLLKEDDIMFKEVVEDALNFENWVDGGGGVVVANGNLVAVVAVKSLLF